ncbi:MAG TPA: hypothetical protein VFI86_10590 [Burkholderiales bacterium]|nr:hypothetical protein [Burkholderiales bacterium]
MDDFRRRVLVVATVSVLALALWRAADVVLLVFAAALLATLLRALAGLIGRAAGLPDAAAYGCAILVAAALLGGAGWLFGSQAREQIHNLVQRLPHAVDLLGAWVDPKSIAARVGRFAVTGFDALGGAALVLFGALYLGAQPALYRRGLVAASQSLELGFWALAVYAGVHVLEAHIVMPFVQRWTIALPPALGVFAVVAVGYLLGPLGVLLATPLTVVAFVLVKRLYLREALGEEAAPGR